MRVLVCDDHSLFREGLRLLLEKLDASMEVTLTASAEEALAATRGSNFDLILMDWHMDGLAGARALEALRESAPLTRVVVLSGDRNAELVRSLQNPEATTEQRLQNAFHLVTSVAGCFVPALGLAGEALFLARGQTATS